MNAVELIAIFRSRGITLEVTRDKLRYRAPVGALTNDVKNLLSTDKARIIAALRESHPLVEHNGPPVDATPEPTPAAIQDDTAVKFVPMERDAVDRSAAHGWETVWMRQGGAA